MLECRQFRKNWIETGNFKENEDRMAEAGRLASNIGKVGIQHEKRVKIYDGSSSRSRSSDASE